MQKKSNENLLYLLKNTKERRKKKVLFQLWVTLWEYYTSRLFNLDLIIMAKNGQPQKKNEQKSIENTLKNYQKFSGISNGY